MTSDLADFVARMLDLLCSEDSSQEKWEKLRSDFKHAQQIAHLVEADMEEY